MRSRQGQKGRFQKAEEVQEIGWMMMMTSVNGLRGEDEVVEDVFVVL